MICLRTWKYIYTLILPLGLVKKGVNITFAICVVLNLLDHFLTVLITNNSTLCPNVDWEDFAHGPIINGVDIRTSSSSIPEQRLVYTANYYICSAAIVQKKAASGMQ